MKILKDILYKVGIESTVGSTDVKINKIEFNSSKVLKNDLFVAIKGNLFNGNHFITDAISRGSKVIVCEDYPKNILKKITYIKVRDVRESLALICTNYYGNPSKKLKLVGITGTNGKTTTANLMFQLFGLLKYKVGLISTNKIIIHKKNIKSDLTTPDPITLNKVLFQMVESNIKFCFMEVSSHSIEQKRIAGLTFDVGVFTNLSHDHLDYHKTFNSYRDVKKIFFDSLKKNAFAIVNIDDKNGNYMTQNSDAKIYSYSLKAKADFSLKIFEKDFNGMKISLNGTELWTKLIGEFNGYNILATYAIAKLFKLSEDKILRNISALRSVEGRFERILKNGVNKIGIVDYAHSPDSLKKILQTINELKKEDDFIITVFGCGGDRDFKKRPLMGRIAASLSDKVILTSDNPRNEEPSEIIKQIQFGIEEKDLHKISIITDREEAIKFACKLNNEKDVILIAGKGHEKFQIFGNNKIEFDDKKILVKSLNNNM